MSSVHDYKDILRIPRPEPKYHQRMPLSDRAAQFAPFAALTGFNDVIEETGRITEDKRMLDEREKSRLNGILNTLQNEIYKHPEVKITYFVPDSKKTGGSYRSIVCSLQKIDAYEKRIIAMNGIKINFDDIFEIVKL